MTMTIKYRGFEARCEIFPSRVHCSIYYGEDDLVGKYFKNILMESGNEEAATKKALCEYIDKNYYLLLCRAYEKRLNHKNRIIKNFVFALERNYKHGDLYDILKKKCYITDRDIQEIKHFSLVPYIDKKEYAKIIANNIVFEGARYLIISNTMVYKENYFNGRYGIDIVNDKEMQYLITNELLTSYSDNIISATVRENEIVIEYEPWCCPNIGNDEAFNITRNEPTLDM